MRSVESAAVVWARASWQRASRRRVLVWGLGGGTGMGVGVGVNGGLVLDLVGERGECGVLEFVVAEAGVGVVGVVVWRVLAS